MQLARLWQRNSPFFSFFSPPLVLQTFWLYWGDVKTYHTYTTQAIDRTTYSKHYRKTNYLTHYMRRVSCAAVFTDANAIINMCKGYKTKALAPPDLADAREFPPPSPAQRA